MKLYIKTLTPVHIGTGKEIEKFEYQINDGKFSRINFSKLSELLMERFPEKFTEWINKVSNEENISNVLYLPIFKKQIAGNSNIEVEISKSVQYKFNCNITPDKKIRENIKTGNNELYIPGTSIKGSIRTALLSDALTRLDPSIVTKIRNNLNVKINNISSIETQIQNLKNGNVNDQTKKKVDNLIRKKKSETEKLKKNICDFIENEIFYCGIERFNSNGEKEIKYSDEKFDLMKCLLISDSNSFKSEENGEISNLKMFKLKQSNGRPLVYSESIAENSYLEFDIRIEKEFILKAKELLSLKNNDFGKKEWIGFKEKFERLYDLKLDNLNRENIESIITDKIFIAVSEIGKKVYQREKFWIDSLNGNVESQFIKKFYSNNEFENSMKVGYGSSFLATTIFLWMYNDKSLKTELEKVLKLFGVGKHTSGSKDDVDINTFPITRKYESNNNEISPLGWIQLSKTIYTKELDKLETSSLINANRKVEKRETWFEAEIIHVKKKNEPTLIKVIEGEYKEIELKLVYSNTAELNIGKRLYVSIEKNKKQIRDSKVRFEGFIPD